MYRHINFASGCLWDACPKFAIAATPNSIGPPTKSRWIDPGDPVVKIKGGKSSRVSPTADKVALGQGPISVLHCFPVACGIVGRGSQEDRRAKYAEAAGPDGAIGHEYFGTTTEF